MRARATRTPRFPRRSRRPAWPPTTSPSTFKKQKGEQSRAKQTNYYHHNSNNNRRRARIGSVCVPERGPTHRGQTSKRAKQHARTSVQLLTYTQAVGVLFAAFAWRKTEQSDIHSLGSSVGGVLLSVCDESGKNHFSRSLIIGSFGGVGVLIFSHPVDSVWGAEGRKKGEDGRLDTLRRSVVWLTDLRRALRRKKSRSGPSSFTAPRQCAAARLNRRNTVMAVNIMRSIKPGQGCSHTVVGRGR